MPESHSQFTECYVAFLDILGVRTLVRDAGKTPALYEALVAALAETEKHFHIPAR